MQRYPMIIKMIIKGEKMKLFAFAMLMASSFTSVHALDLHPVQSLTLAVPADGRFDFDNVNIPAGVILNFAAWDNTTGAQPILIFNVTGNTRIAGEFLASPYDLSFNSGGTFMLESDAGLSVRDGGFLNIASSVNTQLYGSIKFGDGSVMLDAGDDLSGQRSFRNNAGTLNIAAPGMDSFGTPIRSWEDGTQLTAGSVQRLNGGRLYPDLIIQQPIPEVDAWGMLLAGLGIVGLVAHRRRGIAALR